MTRPTVPRLHLIGPLQVVTPTDYIEIALRVTEAAPVAVHVRTPELSAREMLAVARELRQRLPANATLIVNDRVDIAVLASAHGIQLGERSFGVNAARCLAGKRLIGRSIHDLDQAVQAQGDGADFILAGNVFETPSKPGMDGRGTGWLEQIARGVSIPVIALGGITIARIREVLTAGAWGVAMGRELLSADNPASVARQAFQHIEVTLIQKENDHEPADTQPHHD